MGESTTSSPTFGELLRDHRRRAGYSQEALAEQARLSAAAIAALEQGIRRAPYRDTVGALAAALGLADAARREFEETAAGARRRQRRRDGASDPAVSGNIPLRRTSFVGRETQVAELTALLNEQRLVTVTGSGGVGKTRIATEIARGLLGDGWNEAWFVDLAPIELGEHVARTIAAVLGIAVAPAGDPLPSLATQLRRRECLLILDNCEHVVDAAAAAAGAIMRNCPGVTILATSRERLAIEGEHVYRLPSLSAAKALDLLEERAKASDVRLTFTPDGRETGAQICRQLEGIPLAIELAATRVPTLGLDVLNARLRDYVVISGGRDLPQRQRTIYATIAWSYDLLRASEQKLLRRLSIFRGAMTLEGAEAVYANGSLAPEQAAALMSQLVDKSLVEVHADVGQDRRYRLLDCVRTFAAEKLAEAGESIVIARAHAERMAEVADRAHELYAAPDRYAWHKRFAPELDDARAAIEWALNSESHDDVVLAGRILGGLRALWIDAELRAEAGSLAQRVLALIDDERFPFVAAQLHRILVQAAPDKAAVLDAIERATPIFERVDDRTALIGAVLRLAWICTKRGEFSETENALTRAFALAHDERSQESEIYMLMLEYRGGAYAHFGRVEQARADFAERRRRRTLLGISDHRADARWEALIAFLSGNPHEAIVLLEQAMAYLEDTGASIQADLPLEMAAMYLTVGDHATACELAYSVLESMPVDPWTVVGAIQHLGAVAVRSMQPVTAARLLGFADARYQAEHRARSPFEQISHDILVRALREQLEPDEMERCAAAGAQLDLQQAADLASASAPRGGENEFGDLLRARYE
jgi:predicted ATPase/transcriptional regulator with XRE-family HTH domain